MQNSKWIKIDVQNSSKEEIKTEIERLKSLRDLYMNAEQGVKIFINSVYGACGSPWFAFFNVDIAEAVTLQGQDLIKYSEKVLNRYFLEFWHKDVNLHRKMGLTNVMKISKPVVIYCDTDSVHKDTKIMTSEGEMTIEDMFTICKKTEEQYLSEKEYVGCSFHVLNEKNRNPVFSPVKKLIRHKVTKEKWKLKTKMGREIFVTNDHSLVVIRDGKNVEVKPNEVEKGEKVICVRK